MMNGIIMADTQVGRRVTWYEDKGERLPSVHSHTLRIPEDLFIRKNNTQGDMAKGAGWGEGELLNRKLSPFWNQFR
jgi:hypothetical protein